MDEVDTWSVPDTLPRLRDKVPSESLLEDWNAVLHTIPTGTITKTYKMM